jgi:hypothetical protein
LAATAATGTGRLRRTWVLKFGPIVPRKLGANGSLLTRRWREKDSNPRSPVSRIYANTKIAADREHRGPRSAGKWRKCRFGTVEIIGSFCVYLFARKRSFSFKDRFRPKSFDTVENSIGAAFEA